MSRLLTLLAVCASLCSFTGCSTDNTEISNIKTDAIYQIYTASYDAEKDETELYARFRVGGATGTNIVLTGDSSVTCNEMVLKSSSWFGQCYTLSVPGFQEANAFSFKAGDGETFANAIHLNPIKFSVETPEKILLGQSHEISFDGPPLQDGETIRLTLIVTPEASEQPAPSAEEESPIETVSFEQGAETPDNEEANPQKTSFSVTTTEPGATSITILPDDLENLIAGPATIEWVRYSSPGLQKATPTGGEMQGSYTSKQRDVVVE